MRAERKRTFLSSSKCSQNVMFFSAKGKNV